MDHPSDLPTNVHSVLMDIGLERVDMKHVQGHAPETVLYIQRWKITLSSES